MSVAAPGGDLDQQDGSTWIGVADSLGVQAIGAAIIWYVGE
jgi:hypothetical protein